MIAGEPQPDVEDRAAFRLGKVADEPRHRAPRPDDDAEVAMEQAPAVADEWRAPPLAAPTWPKKSSSATRRSRKTRSEPRAAGRWVLGLLVLIVAAAAAFWFFAPAEWKARAGIAQAGATPLQLMITTSDRQPLESGNELVAISGRVINPTDEQQKVPPIRAELRNKATKAADPSLDHRAAGARARAAEQRKLQQRRSRCAQGRRRATVTLAVTNLLKFK